MTYNVLFLKLSQLSIGLFSKSNIGCCNALTLHLNYLSAVVKPVPEICSVLVSDIFLKSHRRGWTYFISYGFNYMYIRKPKILNNFFHSRSIWNFNCIQGRFTLLSFTAYRNIPELSCVAMKLFSRMNQDILLFDLILVKFIRICNLNE